MEITSMTAELKTEGLSTPAAIPGKPATIQRGQESNQLPASNMPPSPDDINAIRKDLMKPGPQDRPEPDPVPALQKTLSTYIERNIKDRMTATGLRGEEWRKIIKPEAVAELEKKLKDCGLADPVERNRRIEELWKAYKNKQFPADVEALKEMQKLSQTLSSLADFVNRHVRDVTKEIRADLNRHQLDAAETITALLKEKGITDPIIHKALLAYTYLESGFKMNCVCDGGISIGWFQLGPEVGIERGNRNGRQQLNALLDHRVLDHRTRRLLGDYYQRGANGFQTFLKWYADHKDAAPDRVAQVFGTCTNPSTATLRGRSPYAASYRELFRS